MLRTEEDFTQSSVVFWLKVVKKDLPNLPKRFTEFRWSDRSNSNQFQPLWLAASNLIMLHLHAIAASSLTVRVIGMEIPETSEMSKIPCPAKD